MQITKKRDVQVIIETHNNHLNAKQKQQLLQLLLAFEKLFDDTLGDWKTKPVSFQLKEGASPCHGWAFPVPKINRRTLMNELCSMILNGLHPPFSNQRKTKPYTSSANLGSEQRISQITLVPKICTIFAGIRGVQICNCHRSEHRLLHHLTGSRCIHDLHYYLSLGKYSYKRLPMRIAGSPDIIQAKMSKLMMSLEYVRT